MKLLMIVAVLFVASLALAQNATGGEENPNGVVTNLNGGETNYTDLNGPQTSSNVSTSQGGYYGQGQSDGSGQSMTNGSRLKVITITSGKKREIGIQTPHGPRHMTAMEYQQWLDFRRGTPGIGNPFIGTMSWEPFGPPQFCLSGLQFGPPELKGPTGQSGPQGPIGDQGPVGVTTTPMPKPMPAQVKSATVQLPSGEVRQLHSEQAQKYWAWQKTLEQRVVSKPITPDEYKAISSEAEAVSAPSQSSDQYNADQSIERDSLLLVCILLVVVYQIYHKRKYHSN